MNEIKISLEELKAAIGEMEARGKGDKISVKIADRKLSLSCIDRSDNQIEAVMYDNCNLGAEFRMTHRLMYMKEKKRI